MDYYRILNIDVNASQGDIKRAYRKLAGKYHPDNAGEQAREQFDRVQEAYSVLGDEEKRAAYDERMRAGEPGDRVGEKAPTEKTRDSRSGRKNLTGIWPHFIPGHIRTVFEKIFRKRH